MTKKFLSYKQLKEAMKDPIIKAIVEDRINCPEMQKIARRAKLGGFEVKLKDNK